MEAVEKIELAEENIRQALKDYGRHTYQTDVLNDVSDSFIMRLARDNYYAKQELRELFRKSPVWDEKLDALVINGTRTHDPDYNRIERFAWQILERPIKDAGDEQYRNIMGAIRYFSNPNLTDEEKILDIEAIKAIAPKAYAPGKKPTRIFRALCVALGVTEDDKFPYLYAQLADEITSRKIEFKLFVSLNPAHFITMSNPKADKRGNSLTSCHSFNSTEYSYNNGCTGYARDKYTFIVFTVVDPTDAETLNNRKNRRQIFCYKPGNGVLLQSRLYNDAGGTHREQTESKIYRDLIQREISALEEKPNLWRTFRYYNNEEINFSSGYGFGGYADWEYEDFNAKVSIRADREGKFEEFEIGTWGLCIYCGEATDYGLYCEECHNRDKSCCAYCDELFDDDDLYLVHDSVGNEIYVCENCRNVHYSRCDCCGYYYPSDDMTEDVHGDWVCPTCLEDNYVRCECCGNWVRDEDAHSAIDTYGSSVNICEDCYEQYYSHCDCCDECVHENDIRTAYDEKGNEYNIGPCCIDKYKECDDCGRLFEADLLVDSLCPDCAKKKEEVA